MRNARYFVLAMLIGVLFFDPFVTSKSYPISLQEKKLSDDVEIITNPKEPHYKDGRKLRIIFEQDLSIGAVDGDDNYIFGNRVYFNTDDEGNFYVVDWDRKRIQKYDQKGRFCLTFGREGQGPGEFSNPWRPHFNENNELYIFDMGHSRISVFDKMGNHLTTYKIPLVTNEAFMTSQECFVTTKTTILEKDNKEIYLQVFGLFDKDFKLLTEIHRKVPDTVSKRGRGPQSKIKFIAEILSQQAFQPIINYFVDENDLIYFGYPKEYEIHVYSGEGKLLKIISRDYDPIKISEKHSDLYLQGLEDEWFRFSPEPLEVKKEILRMLEFPKYLPAYKRFVSMENGWLFVIVDSIGSEYALVDLFDNKGKYTAQFKVNIPTSGLFFKNGKAYALALEDGFRFIKRYTYRFSEN